MPPKKRTSTKKLRKGRENAIGSVAETSGSFNASHYKMDDVFIQGYRSHIRNISDYWEEDCQHLLDNRRFLDIDPNVKTTLARCLTVYEMKSGEINQQIDDGDDAIASVDKITAYYSVLAQVFEDCKASVREYLELSIALAAQALLKEFNEFAKMMVLVHLFLESWSMCDFNVNNLSSDAVLEFMRKKSRWLADRGVVLYVKKRLPCRCLHDLAHDAKRMPDTRLCFRCGKQANAATIFQCTKCHIALYCSVECQGQDWSQHQGDCKYYAATSAVSTAALLEGTGTQQSSNDTRDEMESSA